MLPANGSFGVTVANVAPTVTITTPTVGSVFQSGKTVSFSASFKDAGTADTHTCTIAWGDGTTSTGTVSETAGAGTCIGSHSATPLGNYTIAVTVTDNGGAATSASVAISVTKTGHSLVLLSFVGPKTVSPATKRQHIAKKSLRPATKRHHIAKKSLRPMRFAQVVRVDLRRNLDLAADTPRRPHRHGGRPRLRLDRVRNHLCAYKRQLGHAGHGGGHRSQRPQLQRDGREPLRGLHWDDPYGRDAATHRLGLQCGRASVREIDTSFGISAAGSGASCTITVMSGKKLFAQQAYVRVSSGLYWISPADEDRSTR